MDKNKTIQIFLASSEELKEGREKFGNFIRKLDMIYEGRGMRVKVFEWEDYDAANHDQRKQDEYNEEVRKSDMFLALFHTKAGKYTLEEYNVAMEAYRAKKHPKVYVFCRALQDGEVETPELQAFKERLTRDDKEYFWMNYSNHDQLQLHFIQHLLMVENSLDQLKLDDGLVTLEGIAVAELANLPFAAGNKNYKELKEELDGLPDKIEKARLRCDKYPDDEDLRSELQEKCNRKNYLIEEFARLQKTLFETSQRIATMQREQLSDKLRRATEAFEKGNLDGTNALLDEIDREAETHYANLNQDRQLVHQDIDAFLLRAKTVMAEVKTPIAERVKQVQAIYSKADEWAKNSALPDEKYDGLLDDYASFLRNYGLYKEAEPVHLRLISLREKLYGKEHADTATSYNNIGEVYRKKGNYAKALEYYKKALDVWERVLGPDHPLTAASYQNIGQIYHKQGDYVKALECYGKALDIFERVLGPNHPNTGTSYNDIGGVYDDQDDYATALEYYRKALDVFERVLGPGHPYTASSYNNIGLVYYKQGYYTKALEYYGKALDIWERVLGPDHPNTKTVRENIEICREEMQGE